MEVKSLIDKLSKNNYLNKEELLYLLNNMNDYHKNYLFQKSNDTRKRFYENKVYLRGLIEISNYCIRDCMYCGIRKSNSKAQRYRLSEEEIVSCAVKGDELGYKTIVLQGGEDPYFSDDILADIIRKIKTKLPDNAITLSLGERSFKSYKKLYDAGADRYLLRHETSNRQLYEKLHPNASFDNRRRCLIDLKEIGYQIGAGFMVGLPGQNNEDLVNDLLYLKELEPHMCGIGPFIPQKDTPLGLEKGGTCEKTVILLAIIRLLLPNVLLPATTALSTISATGREEGLRAGANVIMPNLSPLNVRSKYSLYDGKKYLDIESAEYREKIEKDINEIGFSIDISRGDNISWKRK